MKPDYCPHCGAEVPEDVRACPECGSDEQTGWSDPAHADRLGLPAEDFDYDRFVREEFGPPSAGRRPRHWLWLGAAVLLIVAFLFGLR